MKYIDDGLFIVFEGGEGSGKTTISKEVTKRLLDEGYDVEYFREPGSSKLAEQLRDIVVNNFTELEPIGQYMLYSAARRLNTKTNIIPALRANKIIICDRFILSSIVYQGDVGGVDMNIINSVGDAVSFSIRPQMEFILDIDPHVGLTRAMDDTHEQNEIDKLDIAFHQKIRKSYLENSYVDLHKGERIVIDTGITSLNDTVFMVLNNIHQYIKTNCKEI